MSRKTADEIFLTVEPYCILCRLDLPRSRLHHLIGQPLQNKNCKDWELQVIGFFDTAGEDPCSGLLTGPVRSYVFRANLGESSWPPAYCSPIWTLRPKDNAGAPLRVSFIKRPSQDGTHASPHRALFFVHACCWQAVRQLQRRQRCGHDTALTFDRLYRLGQQTRSILPRTCAADEYAAALSGLSLHPAVDAPCPNSLGRLLARAASILPMELQAQIACRLQGGLASSLLRARETASRFGQMAMVERSTMTRIREQRLLALEDDGKRLFENCRGRLVASRIRIFGQTYLHKAVFLGLENSRKRKRSNIDSCTGSAKDKGQVWDVGIDVQSNVDITGAKIWIGSLGVQALALVYEDGSMSPWLGDCGRPSRDRCIQTLTFDSTTTTLFACRDNLKLLLIYSDGPDGSPDIPQQTWPTRTLWNTGAVPARGDLMIADTERYPGHLLYYPGRRLCHFLPLQTAEESATGLTVYCTSSGICGMATHFGGDGIRCSDRQERIGCRCGLAIHLPLALGEYIVFLALRVDETRDGRSDCGPTLIAATNFCRAVHFGRLFSSFSKNSTSVSLTDGRSPVRGLFTDILTADGCCLKSFGTSTDWTPRSNQKSPLPQIVADFPLPPMPRQVDKRFDKGAAFFSTANLASDVEKLQVRRKGPRCVGLCIYHYNGRAEILGSWTPSDSNEENIITDISPPPTSAYSAITFQFSLDGAYVTDVVFGQHAVGLYDVVVFPQDQGHVIWWFTQTQDFIQLWEPTYHRLRFPDNRGNSFRLRETWRNDSSLLDD